MLGTALGCSPFGSDTVDPPSLHPDYVQRGALLFTDVSASGDGTRACATCHPGGGSDDEVYFGGVRVPPETPEGRRTLSLRGAWQTPPYLWDGSAPRLADAIARMLDVEMKGGTLPPEDLVALEAYVLSIPAFDSGRVEPDGTPVQPATLAARRGFEVFTDRAKCAGCHPPPTYAHRFRFDVGTGGKWGVPSLRGVSTAGRLGHDGRWSSLEDALTAMLDTRGITLDNRDFFALKAYLSLL